MELDPAALSIPDRYGLMISVIQPRPIAWVSTQSKDGALNLAPFSFFTGITAEPFSLCFAPVSNRDGRKKDTLLNIEETGQFVVNAATEDNAEKMNRTSADHPRGVSEFKEAGLTPAPSAKVKPPRVLESPVSLECELIQIVTLSTGPWGGNLVIGKVVFVHVADALWKGGRIAHRDLKAVGRLEGSWYSSVADDFELPRPRIEKPR